jgi:integrase
MATFRRLPSGKWRAEVSVNGIRKSSSFWTKPESQRWALDAEAELRGGDFVVSGKTLEDALRRYATEVSPTKKGVRWELIRADALCKDNLSRMLLSSISTAVINQWIVTRCQSVMSSTVNRELNYLAAVFERCKTHWRWIGINPVRGCERPQDPRPRDRRIADGEVSRILTALDGYVACEPVLSQRHEIAVAFLFAIETAMRQGEIWSLDWVHVHLDQRFVHLIDTKNGTSRDVPLSTMAMQLLTLMADYSGQLGRVFKSNQASGGQLFRRACQIAGVEGLTFHDTRHEALTRLARKLDTLDLARMVGHRDPRSLMIYYNATASEIAGRLG